MRVRLVDPSCPEADVAQSTADTRLELAVADLAHALERLDQLGLKSLGVSDAGQCLTLREPRQLHQPEVEPVDRENLVAERHGDTERSMQRERLPRGTVTGDCSLPIAAHDRVSRRRDQVVELAMQGVVTLHAAVRVERLERFVGTEGGEEPAMPLTQFTLEVGARARGTFRRRTRGC